MMARSAVMRSVYAFSLAAAVLALSSASVHATTHYVWGDSPAPDPPYTNWSSAAHTIQEGVDASADGDTVWVTNGTFVLNEAITVTNSITLGSVNGAEATIVDGNGSVSSNRCLTLTGSNIVLEGFTITNGFDAADEGGGGILADGTGWVIRTCTIAGNRSTSGGGGIKANAGNGVAEDSIIRGNAGEYGGGVLLFGNATIRGCLIEQNRVSGDGGGLNIEADNSLVENCVIRRNTADEGGGVVLFELATLRHCRIEQNTAFYGGGGVWLDVWGETGQVVNCFISGNNAVRGAGIDAEGSAVVQGCTLAGNRSREEGGGVYAHGEAASNIVIRNTIVYHNTAPAGPNYTIDFYDGSLLRFDACCITPMPNGSGNITSDPGLLSLSNPHIVQGSVCRDAATNLFTSEELDIDGEARTNGVAPDIGCDEYWAAGVTGELSVAIRVIPGNVVLGHAVTLMSDIQGKASAYAWSLGDGVTTGAIGTVTHTYAATGAYDVVLSATHAEGTVAATSTVHVVTAFTNYVAASGDHVPPFTSWADAATNIQDAVDAAYAGGYTLLAPGTYEHGGASLWNSSSRVVIDKPLHLAAVDPDPRQTVIVGRGPVGTNAMRCVHLTGGARVSGVTLTNGATPTTGTYLDRAGGGALCEGGGIVSNCIVTGNAADPHGAGVACFSEGMAIDCTIVGNTGVNTTGEAPSGGGTHCRFGGTIRNCIISNNTAYTGGGAYVREGGVVSNCLITANTATSRGGGACVYDGVVAGCAIRDNRTETSDGGGVYVGTDGMVRNCMIERNVATNNDYGGGVYLYRGAIYDSTVRWNAARDGGGIYLRYSTSVASNCLVEDNWALRDGGGLYLWLDPRVERCTIRGNGADRYGGGACLWQSGTIRNSSLIANTADGYGGGAYLREGGTLARCIIARNRIASYGGGVYAYKGGTLTNCVVSENWSGFYGAGAYLYRGGLVESSSIVDNSTAPGKTGGGVYGSSAGGHLRNTIIYFNSAGTAPNWSGSSLTFTNCCTTPSPGGVGTVTGDPLFVNRPAADYRLTTNSSCLDTGTNQAWMAASTDLGGSERLVGSSVDIGAYELGALGCGFTATPGKGLVPLAVQFDGYLIGINTADPYYLWDFENDGAIDVQGSDSNAPLHVYPDVGVYTVRLAVSNGMDKSSECIRTDHITVLATNIHYVSHAGAHVYPFTSWSNAAHDIQDAADTCMSGGRVLITNGTFIAPRDITVTKDISIIGVNGPDNTLVDGRGLQRCFYLGSNACASGLTLERGVTAAGLAKGGGVWIADAAIVSNCIIRRCNADLTGGGFYIESGGSLLGSTVVSNTSWQGAGGYIDVTGIVGSCRITANVGEYLGGGIYIEDGGLVRDSMIDGNRITDQSGGGIYMNYGGLAERCVVVSNRAVYNGAGIAANLGVAHNCLVMFNENENSVGRGAGIFNYSSVSRNCTVVGNHSVGEGGGVSDGVFWNCIIYSNTSTLGSNNYNDCTLLYSCTTPQPGGVGNITNPPSFVNPATGNYRLRYGSPCIDAATNIASTISDDIEGAGRPVDGNLDGTNACDMGCYEYDPETGDSNEDGVPDGWYLGYGMNPTVPGLATNNPDGDPHTTGQEHGADTNPTNPASYLSILAISNSPTRVYFISSSNRLYALECCLNLVSGGWHVVSDEDGIRGAGGPDVLTDTNQLTNTTFYRLGVFMP